MTQKNDSPATRDAAYTADETPDLASGVSLAEFEQFFSSGDRQFEVGIWGSNFYSHVCHWISIGGSTVEQFEWRSLHSI
jgi:hypothetical protein